MASRLASVAGPRRWPRWTMASPRRRPVRQSVCQVCALCLCGVCSTMSALCVIKCFVWLIISKRGDVKGLLRYVAKTVVVVIYISDRRLSLFPDCDQSEFRCIGPTAGRPTCIPETQRCDGSSDCPDGSDESLDVCGPPDQCPDRRDFQCPSDKFKCVSPNRVRK